MKLQITNEELDLLTNITNKSKSKTLSIMSSLDGEIGKLTLMQQIIKNPIQTSKRSSRSKTVN